jgi:hypothetical protein
MSAPGLPVQWGSGMVKAGNAGAGAIAGFTAMEKRRRTP